VLDTGARLPKFAIGRGTCRAKCMDFKSALVRQI